jgi:hypothetical protein
MFAVLSIFIQWAKSSVALFRSSWLLLMGLPSNFRGCSQFLLFCMKYERLSKGLVQFLLIEMQIHILITKNAMINYYTRQFFRQQTLICKVPHFTFSLFSFKLCPTDILTCAFLWLFSEGS